jgi:hypothetical protein
VSLSAVDSADTATTRLSISAYLLTFTGSTWNTPQIVTVAAVNDYVARGDIVLTVKNSVLTSDVAWFGVTAGSVAVNLFDDETGAIFSLR